MVDSGGALTAASDSGPSSQRAQQRRYHVEKPESGRGRQTVSRVDELELPHATFLLNDGETSSKVASQLDLQHYWGTLVAVCIPVNCHVVTQASHVHVYYERHWFASHVDARSGPGRASRSSPLTRRLSPTTLPLSSSPSLDLSLSFILTFILVLTRLSILISLSHTRGLSHSLVVSLISFSFAFPLKSLSLTLSLSLLSHCCLVVPVTLVGSLSLVVSLIHSRSLSISLSLSLLKESAL